MANLTAQVLKNRYEIQDRIGKGGMATVYKAVDRQLSRPVAVKMLHDHLVDETTFRDRFEQEAKFIAGFRHPNIVQVYDFDTLDGDQATYYMVMPFLSGPTLEDVLKDHRERGERLPQERVRAIITQIASALGYAHARGMVHRDVKPANILFDENDTAVLTDFGIARLAEGSKLTQEGITVGTPAYMSPEQASGEAVDGRSDLYALGIILYEMLTGEPPYGDDNAISLLLQHLQAPIPSLNDFEHIDNEELDAFIFQALAKSPDERFQTAGEFSDALLAAFAGEPPPNSTSTPGPLGTAPRLDASTSTAAPATAQRAHHNSPLGVVAISMSIIALLLVVALVSQRPIAPAMTATLTSDGSTESMTGGSVESMTGDSADSMTGPYFFSTNFDPEQDTNAYWPMSEGLMMRQLTEEGRYLLTNNDPGRATTTLFEPMYTYTNVRITLDATLLEGSATPSGYGIVYRYVDADNYYVFAVDGRQRFSIWARDGGVWRELRELEGRTWTTNEAVRPIGENNRLILDVYDDTMTGYVNNEQVVSLQDATFDEGSIGIYTATPGNGTLSLAVDFYQALESVAPTESMTGPDGGFIDGLDG